MQNVKQDHRKPESVSIYLMNVVVVVLAIVFVGSGCASNRISPAVSTVPVDEPRTDLSTLTLGEVKVHPPVKENAKASFKQGFSSELRETLGSDVLTTGEKAEVLNVDVYIKNTSGAGRIILAALSGGVSGASFFTLPTYVNRKIELKTRCVIQRPHGAPEKTSAAQSITDEICYAATPLGWVIGVFGDKSSRVTTLLNARSARQSKLKYMGRLSARFTAKSLLRSNEL